MAKFGVTGEQLVQQPAGRMPRWEAAVLPSSHPQVGVLVWGVFERASLSPWCCRTDHNSPLLPNPILTADQRVHSHMWHLRGPGSSAPVLDALLPLDAADDQGLLSKGRVVGINSLAEVSETCLLTARPLTLREGILFFFLLQMAA